LIKRTKPTSSNTDTLEGVSDEDDDKPMFSLVTGKYRQAKRYGMPAAVQETDKGDDSSALILKNQNTSLATMPDSAAGELLIPILLDNVICTSHRSISTDSNISRP
jgi:hypothetical protein